MSTKYSNKRKTTVNVFDGGGPFESWSTSPKGDSSIFGDMQNKFSVGSIGGIDNSNAYNLGSGKFSYIGDGINGSGFMSMKHTVGGGSSDYMQMAKDSTLGDGKLRNLYNAGNEKSKEVWNSTSTADKIGAGIGGAMAIGGATMANAKVDTSKQTSQMNTMKNDILSSNIAGSSQFNYGGSNNNILNQIASTSIPRTAPMSHVNYKDFRPSKGKQWAGVGTATAGGAAAGAKIAGPWGALVGGAVGAISAGLGSLFGRKKAKKEANRINNEIDRLNAINAENNAMMQNANNEALKNATMNNMKQLANNQMANFHAFGGGLDNIWSGANEFSFNNNMLNTQRLNSMDKTKFTAMPQERLEREIKPNTFAGGGQFNTTPSYYPAKSSFGGNNDISVINNGGTHEQNKYEGVPIGLDSNGIPNLVEEGEVIWRGAGNRLIGKHIFADGGSVEQQEDYVFSNRLKPSQTLLNEVNIAVKQKGKKKKDQKSYADIAKDVYKESKERPNDPITNNTINANLGKLKDAQEIDRAREEAKQARKAMANGMAGMMGNGMNPSPEVNQMQDPNMQMQQEQYPEEMQQIQQPQDLSMYNRSGNEMMGQQMAFGGIKHALGDPIPRRDKKSKGITNQTYISPYGDNPYAYRSFDNVVNGDMQYLPMTPGDNTLVGRPTIDNYIANQNYVKLSDDSMDAMYGMNSRGVDFANRTMFIPPVDNSPQLSIASQPTALSYANSGVGIAGTGNANNAAPANSSTSTPIGSGQSTQNPGSSTSYNYDSSSTSTRGTTVYEYDKGKYEANNNHTGDKIVSGFRAPETVVEKIPANEQPPQEPGITGETKKYDIHGRPTFLRYAPVVGSALSFLTDLTDKNDPDYSLVNKIQADANRGTYMPVSPTPIGDYLKYDPFDINYATNKLNAQSAATRRAMMNTSNGNRATAAANMLAADYNAQVGLGEMQKQAYDYNLNQRNIVGNFNKDTNKFNAENDLKAQMANQSALASLKQYKMAGDGEAARLKYQMDMDNAQRKALNATSFFNNLGEVGRENLAYNQAMSNPALYYASGRGGLIDYKGILEDQEENERLAKEAKSKSNSKTTAKASKGGTIRRKNKKNKSFDDYSLSL